MRHISEYNKMWLILLVTSTVFIIGMPYAVGQNVEKVDLVKYVNILQGTNSSYEYSRGNNSPFVGLPHGVNYWPPQTGKNGDGWIYTYNAKTIRGFNESHQQYVWGGPGSGVFSIMPVSGMLVVNENKRAAAFSHSQETGKPNYYAVTFDNGITAELSPTERCAFFQFSFPRTKEAYLILDGYTGMSQVKIYPDQRKITGYVINGRGKFKNYFILQFNQSFVSSGTWENVKDIISNNKKEDEGKGIGAYIQFKKGSKVQVKVTSSHISPDQAEVTLQKELGTFNSISQVKGAAGKLWNAELGKIVVEGGTEAQKKTFYSCLFQSNLFPLKAYEIDQNGNPHYFDPYEGKIYGGYNYSSIGFWDGFRTLFPLQNIINTAFEDRYMKSLLSSYEHNGFFPGEGMIGNHIMSVLADAWAKGIHTFNPDSALKYYFQTVTSITTSKSQHIGRPNYKPYFIMGYIPYPETAEETKPGITAKTLDHTTTAQTLAYAYDDFCAYKLAKMTGNRFYEKIFEQFMYNYQNVFDSTDNFMKARYVDGKWDKQFNPYSWGGAFVEGNAWQWLWSVWHDEQGLINLMGGDKIFAAKLDSLFTEPSDSALSGGYGFMLHELSEAVNQKLGQYAGGNEPSFHIGYLYNYCGQPWKTQKFVRIAIDKLFNAGPDGYPGDLDGGTTAAWYVMSALGVYSVTPGCNQYVIGSPVFTKAIIRLENGREFIIQADNNNSENVYIQSATLNGKPYSHNWITHEDIIESGTLKFIMGPYPNLNRGISNEDKPFSLSEPRR
jgi:predicted alpha-1,2-mannosidase